MIHRSEILDNVRIAAPCHNPWKGMAGNERVRYCADCKLNVFNLSNMQRDEAERLVTETEGRLCVMFYRRTDGTMITRDCPVGLAAMRKRLATAFVTTAALFLTIGAWAMRPLNTASDEETHSSILITMTERARSAEPLKTIINWLDPPGPQALPGMMVSRTLGAIKPPPGPGAK